MMAFEAMEPEHMAFLTELYSRSAGDARQGVPYEALIDALGYDERVTKRLQRDLQRAGWVDHIRTKSNEANHEITLMFQSDAEQLISFTEMLLKLIYEFPGKIPPTP